MIRTRLLCLLLLCAALGMGSGSSAWASEDAPAEAKPWDQEAVGKLAEGFAKHASDAYTAIYKQGGTTGTAGSGSRRDFHRLRDKARIIDREARHYRAAIKDGKGHDETLPVFERLMVEVRDVRVIGRRVMLQEPTREKVRLAGESLQQIGEYYDPSAFESGAAPPLASDPRR
jgi:hypothetical protein